MVNTAICAREKIPATPKTRFHWVTMLAQMNSRITCDIVEREESMKGMTIAIARKKRPMAMSRLIGVI